MDARYSLGRLELGSAGVRADNSGEVRGKLDGRLAIAGGAIPGGAALRRQGREPLEERWRIAGPELRISGGVPGEEVAEAQRAATSRLSIWIWPA